MELNHRIEDWLSARVVSKTRESYLFCWRNFIAFCKMRGKDPLRLVDDYRALKYQGNRGKEDRFLDEWQDLIRAFNTWIKEKYAPTTVHHHLSVVKSFLKEWKIPLDVDLPKHSPVIYHNRDFKKEQIRMILARASQRDRVIYLMLAESGIRPGTAVKLKYWMIKDDFEKEIVPMRILTPSSILKDNVSDRWSFIGEDGFRELKEYLKPRISLKAEDYVFASELPGKVKGEQFSEASISVKFSRICRKLHFERGAPPGKPGHFMLKGLRKFFRNNCKADGGFREFWMGHTSGVDVNHYLTQDPEIHRAEYKRNYEELRILEPTTPTGLKEIQEQLKQKETEITDLRTQVEELKESWKIMQKFVNKEELLADLIKTLNQIGKEEKTKDGSKADV